MRLRYQRMRKVSGGQEAMRERQPQHRLYLGAVVVVVTWLPMCERMGGLLLAAERGHVDKTSN